ncbi:MAG: phosphatidylglycerophosphatase A, partial [Prevotella sp.]|nr:phosphatidylglycerophosphatase A [Prevotella sp.]
MSDNNNRQLGNAPWLHVLLSTGFGAGFVPFAPGTAGALVGLLVWIGLYFV